MRKKKIRHIITRVLELIVLLLASALLLLQTPGVQTRLAQKAVNLAEKNINGRISFSSIKFAPFTTLIIKDLALIDTSPNRQVDTVLSAKHLSATFTLRSLLSKKGGVGLQRVRGKGVNLNLVNFDPDENGFNNNMASIFKSPPPPEVPTEKPDLFSIGKVEVENFHFTMRNLSTSPYDYPGFGMNWSDLELWADARAHGLNYVNSRCEFTVDEVTMHEKSGYSAKAKGYCITGMGAVDILNTRLVDEWSDFTLDFLHMYYKGVRDFAVFPEKVRMSAKLRSGSKVGMQTISYLCGMLPDSPLSLLCEKAQIKGTVKELDILQAKATELYSGSSFDLEGELRDIYLPESARINARINSLNISTEGIGKLLGSFGQQPDFKDMLKGAEGQLSGSIEGPFNDLKANLMLDSNLGKLRLEARALDAMDSSKTLSYKARLSADSFDLGKAGLGELFSKASFSLKSEGKLYKDNPEISIDSLDVKRLEIADYPYSKISGNVGFKNNIVTAKIRCHDDNLEFILKSKFSTSKVSERAFYQINLAMGFADLKALQIDRRGDESQLSLNVDVNLKASDNHLLIGEATVRHVTYTDNEGIHDIGDIKFISVKEEDKIRLSLRSDFADASYSGDPDLSTIIDPILACSVGRSLPMLPERRDMRWNERCFDAKIDIKDTRNVLSFIHQDIKIAQGSRIEAKLGKNSEFKLSLNSKGIVFQDYKLQDMDLLLKCTEEGMSLNSSLGKILLQKGKINFSDAKLKASAKDNRMEMLALLHDGASKELTAQLGGYALFSRDGAGKLLVKAYPEDSHFRIDGHWWDFSQPEIAISDHGMEINDFSIGYKDQQIKVYGAYSNKINSQLNLQIDKLELSTITRLLQIPVALEGQINGYATINTPSKTNAGLSIEVECPQLNIENAMAGRIHLNCELDDEDDLIKFTLVNKQGKSSNAIKVDGSFNSISNYINARVAFNDFNPAIAQPLVSDYLSEMDGSIEGKVSVTGTPDKLNIRSNSFKIKNMCARVEPTGVLYTLNGDLRMDKDGLMIERIDILDERQGRALIEGRIPGTTVHLEHFNVVNKRNRGDSFWGDLSIDGDIRLIGEDLSSLLVDADIANSGMGRLNINVSGLNQSQTSLLQFKEAEEQGESLELEELSFSVSQEKRKHLEMKCRVNVSPLLEIIATLDKDGANALNISGDGLVTLDMDPGTGLLSLGGDYNITSGKYHFSALSSIISKDFIIEQGSSLAFAGDLMDTELDINATHTLKATLGTLISDTTAVSTRRTVNCGIKISDKLRNPQLAFSIDVPDLDPSTKSLVDSELNTEDKISRQFLALVVTGGFLPGSQSGITNTSQNNSNLLMKNIMSIMSGQLNSVLQKLGIPLDFGLSYQQNEVGNDIYDMSVSTQLFDNMVSVNGTLGNRKYSSSSDESMVGDFEAEIKMNRSGNFRLKLFSHSADDYTNYLDNTQRNGVGITFQKEYENLGEFLRSLFKKKEEQAPKVQKNKVLEIK